MLTFVVGQYSELLFNVFFLSWSTLSMLFCVEFFYSPACKKLFYVLCYVIQTPIFSSCIMCNVSLVSSLAEKYTYII